MAGKKEECLRMPTLDECEKQAQMPAVNGFPAYACWYPQMGGYVSRCIVVLTGGCFDAYVWHDGDFPFDDQYPRQLHHCDAGQFVEFGKFVLEAQGRHE